MRLIQRVPGTPGMRSLTSTQVEPPLRLTWTRPSSEAAILPLGVHRVVVVGVGGALEAVGAEDLGPVGGGDALAVVRPARAAPAAVVLQAAVDAVRLAQVHADAVELRDRQVLEVLPV